MAFEALVNSLKEKLGIFKRISAFEYLCNNILMLKKEFELWCIVLSTRTSHYNYIHFIHEKNVLIKVKPKNLTGYKSENDFVKL